MNEAISGDNSSPPPHVASLVQATILTYSDSSVRRRLPAAPR
jgi:hypothetical protein